MEFGPELSQPFAKGDESNEKSKKISETLNQAKMSAIPDTRSKIEFGPELCQALPEVHKPKKRNTPKKSKYENLPLPRDRFDGRDHVLNYDQGERKAHRCKLEGCDKRTTVYCEKCEVHLCLVFGVRNCFKRFHNFN